MRGWAQATAAVVVAAVVWQGLGELAWPARAYALFLLVALPPLAMAQVGVAEEDPAALPRVALYLTSAAALWGLAVAGVWAGRASGFGVQELGLVPLAAGPLLAWSGAATLGAVAVAVAGRLLGVRESAVVEHLLPRRAAERVAFVGLALSAGITEEAVFRGFLIPVLAVATDSTVLAVGLSCGVFGLLHAYQRAAGAARAALLGGVLAVPLLATGSIVPSMIAHFLYDVVAGLWLGRWLLRR